MLCLPLTSLICVLFVFFLLLQGFHLEMNWNSLPELKWYCLNDYCLVSFFVVLLIFLLFVFFCSALPLRSKHDTVIKKREFACKDEIQRTASVRIT